MRFKTGYLENGELKFKDEIEINQNELTSDCWLIQIRGLKACEECNLKNTEDCGGQEIIKKLNKIKPEKNTK